MARQGQHRHDDNDQNISKSNNDPSKSQDITTGTYKTQETYKKQAALHEDSGKTAQHAKAPHHTDTREDVTLEADSEERALRASKRSGSDSNADSGSRGH